LGADHRSLSAKTGSRLYGSGPRSITLIGTALWASLTPLAQARASMMKPLAILLSPWSAPNQLPWPYPLRSGRSSGRNGGYVSDTSWKLRRDGLKMALGRGPSLETPAKLLPCDSRPHVRRKRGRDPGLHAADSKTADYLPRRTRLGEKTFPRVVGCAVQGGRPIRQTIAGEAMCGCSVLLSRLLGWLRSCAGRDRTVPALCSSWSGPCRPIPPKKGS
jgi:hypothetical protein